MRSWYVCGSCLAPLCCSLSPLQRYTGSMPMHPLPVLMNQGVHVALSSDDPAMFGNMGLSFDFFQVGYSSDVDGNGSC